MSTTPPPVDIDPKKDCVIMRFTGGATGIPKGVMSSHSNVVANPTQLWSMLPLLTTLRGRNIAIALAMLMYHAGGFQYITDTYLGLTQILIPDNRDYDAIIEALNTYRPLLNVFVPAQWMKIVKNEKLKHVPLLGFSGAAPLPPDASREMESEKGGLMGEVYGQSEANVVVTANVSLVNKFLPGGEKSLFIVRATTPLLLKMIPSLFSFAQTRFGYWLFSSLKKITAPAARRMIKRKAKSRKVARGVKKGCGIPLPDTDVKLLNIDTGEEVPIGEPGELYYRGPQLMLGYWPKVGNGLTEDGYLGSGDVAIMDEDGFFQIVDRTKDMINVAGFKVYSEVLDELLSTHPSVYLAGCIGAPDPERPGSEKVAAFIQLNEGYAPSKDLETELTEMADKKLPAYYKPKIYVFLDDMPLNHVDKVNKLVLREMQLRSGS